MKQKEVLNKVYLYPSVVVYRHLLNVYYGHKIFTAATKITAFCFCGKKRDRSQTRQLICA